jgi:hypothetical protein
MRMRDQWEEHRIHVGPQIQGEAKLHGPSERFPKLRKLRDRSQAVRGQRAILQPLAAF